MIKGILFDKDGTLIDFFSLWLGAAKAVVIQFFADGTVSAVASPIQMFLCFSESRTALMSAVSTYCA